MERDHWIAREKQGTGGTSSEIPEVYPENEAAEIEDQNDEDSAEHHVQSTKHLVPGGHS